MKLFALYEEATKSLYIGSPKYSKLDDFQRFLEMYSFMDFIPRKWRTLIVPSQEHSIGKDKDNNVFFVARYEVLFPLSVLLRFQSQREKFAKLFYEFKYEKQDF